MAKKRKIDSDAPTITFRQPYGIDLREIARKNNIKMQHILRSAVLEYLERNQLSAD